MKKRVTVYINESVWKEFKVLAVQKDTSMSKLLGDMIEERLRAILPTPLEKGQEDHGPVIITDADKTIGVPRPKKEFVGYIGGQPVYRDKSNSKKGGKK